MNSFQLRPEPIETNAVNAPVETTPKAYLDFEEIESQDKEKAHQILSSITAAETLNKLLTNPKLQPLFRTHFSRFIRDALKKLPNITINKQVKLHTDDTQTAFLAVHLAEDKNVRIPKGPEASLIEGFLACLAAQKDSPNLAECFLHDNEEAPAAKGQTEVPSPKPKKRKTVKVQKGKDLPDANVAEEIKEKVDLQSECPNHNHVKEKYGQFAMYDLWKKSFDKCPVFQFKDNEGKFRGNWKEGIREGVGEMLWPDGSYYVGEWKNDLPNGKGRLIQADGQIYEGDWVDGKAEGEGRHIFNEGFEYIGSWKDDKQNGTGKETWPDGTYYQGEYSDGSKNGKGLFMWSNGCYYEGDFKSDKFHGRGFYVWGSGNTYNGEWKDNKMNGGGVFTWSDGRKYEGAYVDDKKQGFGIMTWPNGRKYEGSWHAGKKHGKGIYATADGKRKKGLWANGKRAKWLEAGEGASSKSLTNLDENAAPKEKKSGGAAQTTILDDEDEDDDDN